MWLGFTRPIAYLAHFFLESAARDSNCPQPERPGARVLLSTPDGRPIWMRRHKMRRLVIMASYARRLVKSAANATQNDSITEIGGIFSFGRRLFLCSFIWQMRNEMRNSRNSCDFCFWPLFLENFNIILGKSGRTVASVGRNSFSRDFTNDSLATFSLQLFARWKRANQSESRKWSFINYDWRYLHPSAFINRTNRPVIHSDILNISFVCNLNWNFFNRVDRQKSNHSIPDKSQTI